MKLIIDIPEEDYKGICNLKNEQLRMLPVEVAETLIRIANSTPLDNLRTELEDYITHSPYINGCTNCCRLRDDVCRIIDHYRNEVSEF